MLTCLRHSRRPRPRRPHSRRRKAAAARCARCRRWSSRPGTRCCWALRCRCAALRTSRPAPRPSARATPAASCRGSTPLQTGKGTNNERTQVGNPLLRGKHIRNAAPCCTEHHQNRMPMIKAQQHACALQGFRPPCCSCVRHHHAWCARPCSQHWGNHSRRWPAAATRISSIYKYPSAHLPCARPSPSCGTAATRKAKEMPLLTCRVPAFPRSCGSTAPRKEQKRCSCSPAVCPPSPQLWHDSLAGCVGAGLQLRWPLRRQSPQRTCCRSLRLYCPWQPPSALRGACGQQCHQQSVRPAVKAVHVLQVNPAVPPLAAALSPAAGEKRNGRKCRHRTAILVDIWWNLSSVAATNKERWSRAQRTAC